MTLPCKASFVPVAMALGAACAGSALADDACMTAVHANFGAKSYETRMSMTRAGGASSSLNGLTIDMVKPDSIAVHGKAMDLVAIGDKTWMRENGGAWRSIPGAMGGLASMNPEQFMSSKGKMTCSAAGTRTWDGQSATVYEGTYIDAKGQNTRGTFFVLPDGYVHHMTWTASDGSSGTIDSSKFNAVTIGQP